MRDATFAGGIHPSYNKDRTSALGTSPLAAPERVYVPLSQHIGAPAKPCVEKGDEVAIGQMIGEPGGFVSAPIHSSVSGKVAGIEPRAGAMGIPVQCVVIENDGEDRRSEHDGAGDAWEETPADELKERIRMAGIVGMGGAAFPTHVKLSPPPDKPIDTLILNGAECEPYLTADHRTMLERATDVVAGARILARILGVARTVVAVESNKPDAIQALDGAGAEIRTLAVKYPQGAEKQIIDACLQRQVPSGGLPMDVGVVVQNVGTAVAVADAVIRGRPLTERIVTVTGDAVGSPANLLVRVGTPVGELLAACDADLDGAAKLVLGGPMMGFAQTTPEPPVTKGTSGVLLLTGKHVDTRPPAPCIRCGRCARACPMRLVPTEIGRAGLARDVEASRSADAMDCVECGSCAHDCPSRIPLVQQIRLAKAAVTEAARRERGTR